MRREFERAKEEADLIEQLRNVSVEKLFYKIPLKCTISFGNIIITIIVIIMKSLLVSLAFSRNPFDRIKLSLKLFLFFCYLSFPFFNVFRLYRIIWIVYFESCANPSFVVSRKLKISLSVNLKILINYI